MNGNEPPSDPDDMVRAAAAQLGVEVPPGLVYLGSDQTLMIGTADEFRVAVALLNRIDGLPIDQCWPPDPAPDPRTLSEMLADWKEQRGDLPPMFMGIKRVVEVLDHAPEELTPAERLVLVAIAENVRDEDPSRETWPGFNARVLARRSGLTGEGLKRALQRLAKRGMEVRVPISIGKDGRPLFAVPGQQCRYKLPVIEHMSGCGTPEDEGGTPVPPSPHKGGTGVPAGGTGVPPMGVPQSRQAGREYRPTPHPSRTPHSSPSVARHESHAGRVVEERQTEARPPDLGTVVPLWRDDALTSPSRVQDTRAATSGDFDAFWREYPRKVGKADAKKAFAAAVKDGADPADLATAAAKHRHHWHAEGRQPGFIPHPATWLRRGSYDDELHVPQPPAPQQPQQQTYADRGVF